MNASIHPRSLSPLAAAKHCALALAAAFAVGCSDGTGSAGPADLSGQVSSTAASAGPVATHYAASRFLEQAAMGPSPADVAQVRRLGMAAWIDAQMKLPATVITTPAEQVQYDLQDRAASDRANDYHQTQLHNTFVGSPDQLRVRTSWVLSNFLVVSNNKVQPYGATEFFNTLQKNAFGQYGDLLKAVTRSPAMGFYLDNGQNRKWSLNENYGRELMQLFSVGLVQLNTDGSVKRDASGKPLETYSQRDVIEVTKALTGWMYVPKTVQVINDSNGFNYGYAMVPDNGGHETSEKKPLGRTIPAGQTTEADLDSLITILIEHPNTAPFVSLRLIQGLTTSDPSAAYIARVAKVFQESRGNLGLVVRAILVDSEARAGDVPSGASKSFGRIKEPHMLVVSFSRGMGCQRAPLRRWTDAGRVRSAPWSARYQSPLGAPSVFSFYAPDHRAPISKLLAPEQKALTSDEFSDRMGPLGGYDSGSESAMIEAGCEVQAFKTAAQTSMDSLLDLLSERYFRGAMTGPVRQALAASPPSWISLADQPFSMVGSLMGMASITPAYGVSK